MREPKIDAEVSRHPKYWLRRYRWRRMARSQRRLERLEESWAAQKLVQVNADLFTEDADGQMVLRGDDGGC